MQIKKCLFRTRCDNGACRNAAVFRIVREDTPTLMQLNLCQTCAKEVCESLGKILKRSNADKGKTTKKEVQQNVGVNT